MNAVPSEPLNLDYVNDTSTSVNITWEPPANRNGIIESYTLQITDMPTSDIPNVTNIAGSSEFYLLTGLLPYQTYELVLYALTDRGEGPGSTPLIIYTLEDRK